MNIYFYRQYKKVSFEHFSDGLMSGINQFNEHNAFYKIPPEIDINKIDWIFGIGTATTPNNFISMPRRGKYRAAYIVGEATGYPKRFKGDIAKVDCYFVACNYLYDIFTRAGIMPYEKTYIVPHGIDTNIWVPVKRPKDRKPYTILDVSVLQYRKGHDVLLKAFTELSDSMPGELRLIIKGNAIGPGPLGARIMDPYLERKDIVWIQDYIDTGKLLKLYQEADLFVHPHRGEGFSFTIMEAMRTGLPVITTGYGGNMEYCNKDNCYFVNHRLNVVPQNGGFFGYWAEPDKNHLKKLILECYDHQERARRMGKKAAEFLKSWSWEWSATLFTKALLDYQNKYPPKITDKLYPEKPYDLKKIPASFRVLWT